MAANDHISFREKLDQAYTWPALYMFKFIVPKGKEQEVVDMFPQNEVIQRESKHGNYISLTIQIMASGSEQVIDIYERANQIDGLMAL